MSFKPGSVTLGFISDGHICAGTVQSLLKLALDPRFRGRIDFDTGGGFIEMESGPRIASSRNMLVDRFLATTTSEWLWMLDTDHTFTPDILERMLEWADPVNAPIIGALCFSGGAAGTITPTMMRLHEVNKQIAVEHIYDFNPGDVIEVDATGAACLLVHRFVLEDMRKLGRPWFYEGYAANGGEFGEDVNFCIGAKGAGARIFVHTGIEAPHIKGRILDSVDYFAFREQAARYGEDQLKAVAKGKRDGIIVPLVEPKVVPLNRQQRRQLERQTA